MSKRVQIRTMKLNGFVFLSAQVLMFSVLYIFIYSNDKSNEKPLVEKMNLHYGLTIHMYSEKACRKA